MVHVQVDHVESCLKMGKSYGTYPLVMTNIAMVFRWPIEIDGLPIKNGDFNHGYERNRSSSWSMAAVSCCLLGIL